MQIWAHKGKILPTLKGNSLQSFQNAFSLGVDGIETDVCFMAPNDDGYRMPVIYHPRKSGRGLNRISWDDLKLTPQVKVLCLDDFLKFLKSKSKLLCFLEIKENNENLLNVVIQKISEYELEERVYLTVCQVRVPLFQLEAPAEFINKARRQNPRIRTHIIATFPFSLEELYYQYHPDIISLGWLPNRNFSIWFFKNIVARVVNLRKQIKNVQSAGLKVIGGIVNDEEGFKYFTKLGVDGIMTDNSVAAMKFRRKLESQKSI